MKNWNGRIREFLGMAKWFTGLFLIILSIGFFSGIRFVDYTTNLRPQGIQESFLGNEELDEELDEEVDVMKYKKTKQEMLTTLHTHILSLSVIFFLSGILVLLAKAPPGLKKFLAFEPLISIILTFGGLYLMWDGLLWMKYVVIISGILMTICFMGSVLLVLWNLIRPSSVNSPK